MFRDDHVLAQKLEQIEIRLPNAWTAPVLQFCFPIPDATAQKGRQSEEQNEVQEDGKHEVHEIRNPKAEDRRKSQTRNPESEGRKKAEIRRPKSCRIATKARKENKEVPFLKH